MLMLYSAQNVEQKLTMKNAKMKYRFREEKRKKQA